MTFDPIPSYWFNYNLLTTVAKAINQSENPINQTNSTLNNKSLFNLIFSQMLNSNLSSSISYLSLNKSLDFSSFSNTYHTLSLRQVNLDSNDFNPYNQLTNFDFKPIQFLKLENRLQGKLSGTANYFIQAGQKYNIDPALLAAISMHETGNGRSKAVHEKLNVAGMMGKNGLKSYSSLEESIFDMARNLRENYINKGKNTIAAIGAKYAPIGVANDPTGLNNYWVSGVSKFYNELTV